MKLINDNNLNALKTLPDNSVDSVVTDAPYGISIMNKKWDYDVPSTEFWREVLRVLKPGGYLLCFSAARTYHRMVVNIEDAGFEIRDQIMWLYGTGVPKGYDVGKAFEKLTDSAEYRGWNTYLKPAHEPICMAQKPVSEKNYAKNMLKWRTGGINVGACKIELSSAINSTSNPEGRFPANIIFDEYAAQILDSQTGTLKSGKIEEHHKRNKTLGEYQANCYGKFNFESDQLKTTYGDEGGGSRFFYVAKASPKEKNLGLQKPASKGDKAKEILDNNHPTVKPVNLMTYLCRLVTPPGGTVLDPYMGSGSIGIAALLEGFDFIGMELEENYFKIAEARIADFEEYRDILKDNPEMSAMAA